MTKGTPTPNLALERALRHLGWTLAVAAERVNEAYEEITGSPGAYDAESIRRLLRGKVTWPHPDYRAALRSVFRVRSDSDIGFYSTRRRTTAKLRGMREKEEDVRRIDFLRGFAVLTGSALTGGSLAATLDDAARATAAAPQAIGEEHIAQVRDATAFLRSGDFAGTPLSLQAMAGQLRWAVDLLDASASHQDRIDLHAEVGSLAKVVGWAYFDQGHHHSADRYFRIGLHCADVAGSWWLRSEVLTCMARQAIYIGQPDEALTLLGAARVREDRISPLRRASLSTVQARAYGTLGNAEECLRSVKQAEDHFNQHDRESGGKDDPRLGEYAKFYSTAQLHGDTAGALAKIAAKGAHFTDACRRLRFAVDHYPAEYFRSALFSQSRLATLLLRHGDQDEAAAVGMQVLGQVRGIPSRRLRDKITEIRAVAKSAHRPVVELRQKATDVLHRA
ncbi:hypothetical protein [Actinoalloteichus caeruleus]|uniref:hypothetical protein n=1 Tax=Actinoalloteichus cyanogriseus TaxID=2893586 RepID=UPI003BB97083